MPNIISKTDGFLAWIDGLKDQRGRARVLARIVAAEAGNFGDCGPVGDVISEMRIHYGPGYRVYFAQEGLTFICSLQVATRAVRSKTSNRPKRCGTI
jgi:putative addiction module killer protein